MSAHVPRARDRPSCANKAGLVHDVALERGVHRPESLMLEPRLTPHPADELCDALCDELCDELCETASSRAAWPEASDSDDDFTPPLVELRGFVSSIDTELAARRLFGELRPPPKIGRFELLDTVGAGGMGVVYAAWDPLHACKIAIKLARPSPWLTDTDEQRLAGEGRVGSRFVHPNIVTIHEHGVHDGRVYVAMEFVEGLSLDRWLKAAPRCTAELLELFLAAGSGLAAIHHAGFVHRDFKPANVMVDRGSRPRIVDFGLARAIDSPMTDPGRECGGTPRYMAPELFEGACASPTTDVYAFCVSLLECARVIQAELPGAVVEVLQRGIERRASARWPDMHALLDALQRGVERSDSRSAPVKGSSPASCPPDVATHDAFMLHGPRLRRGPGTRCA